MTLEQVLAECLKHFACADMANAAMHCAPVKFSPITFRVAEVLDASGDVSLLDERERELLRRVISERGAYEEDKGR